MEQHFQSPLLPQSLWWLYFRSLLLSESVLPKKIVVLRTFLDPSTHMVSTLIQSSDAAFGSSLSYAGIPFGLPVTSTMQLAKLSGC
ncbi:hypothetical protein Nepgr_018493 [Nepenthes gracilis]|uniref:Uncharacterized protein n=1 Tax=Nepenthes gracilis TaxID=150966 RepID=A0AAD3SU45_NEPGR|nr:hypothetical protein Nepgr_018493 [Nepenthes gracilis]